MPLHEGVSARIETATLSRDSSAGDKLSCSPTRRRIESLLFSLRCASVNLAPQMHSFPPSIANIAVKGCLSSVS